MNALATLPPASSVDPLEVEFDRRLARVTEAVDLYHTHLSDYVFALTGNHADTADILQNLWRYVVLHFKEDQIGQVGLLRRKAYQLFVDCYRSQRRRLEVVTDTLPEVPAPEGREQTFSPEEEERLKERFWSDFEDIELTDRQREALWRHARYGFTYAEISEHLQVPVSTVGDWIALARKRLATRLNRQH